jgi:hypothetical protein
MIVHILEAEPCGAQSLRLLFDDGTRKRVNVARFLEGPIFEPLRDPAYFARVTVDPVGGTVVWPNVADFAPETLHDLPAEDEPLTSDTSDSGPKVAITE